MQHLKTLSVRQERSGSLTQDKVPEPFFIDLATSFLPCTPLLAYLIRINHIENLCYIYSVHIAQFPVCMESGD